MRGYNLHCLIVMYLLILLFFTPTSSRSSSSSSSSSSLAQKYFENERSALLQLKRDLSAERNSLTSPPQPSVSLLPSWKPNTNCCSWEGVTCHNVTKHVVYLDLSGNQLSGHINSSNLHQLSYLQRLNLAENDFQSSPIPSRLDLLSKLTHLNLSNSGFLGQVPWEISRLTNLVSLDLSTDNLSSLKLEDPNLELLIRNLYNLRELDLDGVNISAHGSEWCNSLPLAVPNLGVLSLSSCELSGPICESLVQLQFLSKLHLSSNNFSSMMPRKIMQLPNLRSLDISGNNHLAGTLPEFPRDGVLEVFSLAFTSFFGKLPDSIGNLKFLTELDLRECNFAGLIPSSLANLTQLVGLDLSSNRFDGWIPFLPPLKNTTKTLTDPIETSYHVGFLQNLAFLAIENNSMKATIHSSLFTLPSLKKMLLKQNRLAGALNEFHNASSSLLEFVDLSSNNLEGNIPKSVFELPKLTELRLSVNNFSSTVDPGMFINLKNLELLDLSYNTLLLISNSSDSPLPQLLRLFLNSCNISEFPHFLRNQEGLVEVDLSNNKIHGQIPKWVWKESLLYLNLSHNYLNGLELPVPDRLLSSLAFLDLTSNLLQGSSFPILPPFINFLSFSENKLTGEIPLSICNASSLAILDTSYNHMSGQIPKCLGDISATLTVVKLRENNFDGTMPWNFTEGCSLKTLDLYGNQLEGRVPKSLAKCEKLEALDLGDNQINDTFPFWLENLPKLQVLILQSNKFHGPIGQPRSKNAFPMLHILDLSSNALTGKLPLNYFQIWKSMMINLNTSKLYLGGYYYKDWITLTNKGLKMERINILTIFNVLDLSNNQFEGEIPEVIGDLKMLQVLNVSRNRLMGEIPSSLSNLTSLESLDLSQNKLSGEIPRQLTSLTFLSVLNLSHNRLVGSIPQGNQFSTFTNDSYVGNLDLCGLPLSRKCGDDETPPPSTPQENFGSDSIIHLYWKIVLTGYGCGVVLGGGIGYILFWRTQCCTVWIEQFSRAKGSRKRIQHRRRRR